VPPVSVTIITLNEAEHIAAAIDSVSWADEVIVVDSGSTDGTLSIARERGARTDTRAWTGWIDQKNYAATLARNDWILSLDADERVSPELAAEIRALLTTEPARRGYRMPRVTFHLGQWIRTTDFYPDYQTRLYDRRAARWTGRYVHESVNVDGCEASCSTTRIATSGISCSASTGTQRSPRSRCTRADDGPAGSICWFTRGSRSCATTSCAAAFSTETPA
jgi:glycosyltransferase involved in cell wall biosynthesis